MTRSMTAYGRATSDEGKIVSLVVEINSVNRKHFDVTFHMPKELLFFEGEFRKKLSDRISRGQHTVRISYRKVEKSNADLFVLQKYKQQWEEKAENLGYDKADITLPFLLEQFYRNRVDTELLSEEIICQTFDEAIIPLLSMKENEGRALAVAVRSHLKKLQSILDEIEKEAEGVADMYRAKLLSRLQEILKEAAEDERVFREVAIFAEKTDCTEEIIRLRSHMGQMEELLTSEEVSIGRTLEFLVQEMLREANTISAKSGTLPIAKRALLIKAEIDKIREQVHNIE